MATAKAAMKKLGFLNSASAKELAAPVAAFRRGLKHAGFVEKKNVSIIYQWAKHDLGKLPSLADKLVAAGVDVLAATGGLAAAHAAVDAVRKSGKPIRVVFVGGFDPVRSRLVDDLERPSNATGVNTATTECLPARLKFAHELLGSKPIDVLVRSDTAVGKLERDNAGRAAVVEAGTAAELKTRFEEAKRAGHALVVSSDPFYTSNHKKIVALAKKTGVPAIFAWREYVDAGGLMSYGPSLPNAYRQAGTYVGHILEDLTSPNPPVVQASSELTINLKTAKALGIRVPRPLLARAHHVVD